MKKFLEHPVLKILLNQYVLTGLLFAIWMVFLDANNYFIHSELDQQIESLEADIEFYETSLEHDRELLQQLNTNPEANPPMEPPMNRAYKMNSLSFSAAS